MGENKRELCGKERGQGPGGTCLAEPLLERVLAVEKLRHDEVQQRPQLRQAVLDGRPRQQQAVAVGERQQNLPAQRVGALDGLRGRGGRGWGQGATVGGARGAWGLRWGRSLAGFVATSIAGIRPTGGRAESVARRARK